MEDRFSDQGEDQCAEYDQNSYTGHHKSKGKIRCDRPHGPGKLGSDRPQKSRMRVADPLHFFLFHHGGPKENDQAVRRHIKDPSENTGDQVYSPVFIPLCHDLL